MTSKALLHGAKGAKEEDQKSFLCGPFGGVYPDKGRAQDRLGAKNFVEVVLLNILSVST